MANFCMYCGKPTNGTPCVHANPPPPLPQNVISFPNKATATLPPPAPPANQQPKQQVIIEQALAVQEQFNQRVITALTNTLNTLKGMGDAINKLENALALLEKKLDNKN